MKFFLSLLILLSVGSALNGCSPTSKTSIDSALGRESADNVPMSRKDQRWD